MSATQKPVVVLVHGAWHRPLHYIDLFKGLRDKGFTVVTPVNTTAGWDDSIIGKTHFDDAKIIQSAMDSYLNSAGTAAAEGNTTSERASKGQKGGIISVVDIAAFALPQAGTSLYMAVGNRYLDWWDVQVGRGDIRTRDGTVNLLNDIDQTMAEIYTSSLVKQSLSSFMMPITYAAAEIKAPKKYIACKLDQAIAFEAQVGLGQAAGAEVFEVASGHSPFLKEEERLRLLDIIADAAAHSKKEAAD